MVVPLFTTLSAATMPPQRHTKRFASARPFLYFRCEVRLEHARQYVRLYPDALIGDGELDPIGSRPTLG
jgi:hypothetical protein